MGEGLGAVLRGFEKKTVPECPRKINLEAQWGEGSKNVSFCPHSGNKNYPRRGGGGVKKWQNSVHVVVECPLMILNQKHLLTTPVLF